MKTTFSNFIIYFVPLPLLLYRVFNQIIGFDFAEEVVGIALTTGKFGFVPFAEEKVGTELGISFFSMIKALFHPMPQFPMIFNKEISIKQLIIV
jgi:hypothetical protein